MLNILGGFHRSPALSCAKRRFFADQTTHAAELSKTLKTPRRRVRASTYAAQSHSFTETARILLTGSEGVTRPKVVSISKLRNS
jgi:hypothetical protein